MQDFPQLQVQIEGRSPFIPHNGQTADPRNPYSKALKAISGKRKKTDADLDEMARIEWLAGLYRSNDDLVIPDWVWEAAFIAGAKKSKRGTQAKSGLFFSQHASLVFPDKPEVITDETLNDLFEDGHHTFTIGVKVGMSRVMRTRPIFRHWSCTLVLEYDPDVLNQRDVEEIAHDTGRLAGVGDWRPKHGRFEATVVPLVVAPATLEVTA